MKRLNQLLSVTMMTTISLNVLAQESMTMSNENLQSQMNEATLITLTAQPSQSQNLAELLDVGAQLVKKHEPDTLVWFALKSEDQLNDNQFAIFDTFTNNDGREAHFNGKTANALYTHSEQLVTGGWENGVLENITNSSILSAHVADNLNQSTKATSIKLTAAPGQSESLKNLLESAAAAVGKTESNTLFWVALQHDENTFSIFDTFTDQNGREEHFSGQVASSLKSVADDLVEGGWEHGVLSNVEHYEIISMN